MMCFGCEDKTDSVSHEDESEVPSAVMTVDVKSWREEVLELDSMTFVLGDDSLNNFQFDFETNPNLTINYPDLVLSGETTIGEFADRYPESSKLNRPSGYLWRGVVKVFASKKEADLDFWLAEFRHEKLSKLSLYQLRRSPGKTTDPSAQY